MDKPKHTPGPWKVRAATFCEDGVPSYEVVMPGEPQMNALDARLIAAAPDLLAACESMVEWYENESQQIVNMDEMKAAIAKAKAASLGVRGATGEE